MLDGLLNLAPPVPSRSQVLKPEPVYSSLPADGRPIFGRMVASIWGRNEFSAVGGDGIAVTSTYSGRRCLQIMAFMGLSMSMLTFVICYSKVERLETELGYYQEYVGLFDSISGRDWENLTQPLQVVLFITHLHIYSGRELQDVRKLKVLRIYKRYFEQVVFLSPGPLPCNHIMFRGFGCHDCKNDNGEGAFRLGGATADTYSMVCAADFVSNMRSAGKVLQGYVAMHADMWVTPKFLSIVRANIRSYISMHVTSAGVPQISDSADIPTHGWWWDREHNATLLAKRKFLARGWAWALAIGWVDLYYVPRDAWPEFRSALRVFEETHMCSTKLPYLVLQPWFVAGDPSICCH